MKFAQLVIGPAGSGKSSYCEAMYEHCCAEKRVVHVINLDPAAEHFNYPVSIDIRELIKISDVSEELKLGPNGGLIFCLQYFIDNIQWFEEKLGDYDNDYLIIDCPGQIELYTHIPIIKTLTNYFTKQWQYNMCALYLLDSTFITDASKFISGMLACLSAMIQLELPHINVLTKIDLLKETTNDIKINKKQNDKNENENENDYSNGFFENNNNNTNNSDNFENEKKENDLNKNENLFFENELENEGLVSRMELSDFCEPDTKTLISKVCYDNDKLNINKKFKLLTKAIGELIDNYSMVSFLPLSIKDTKSVEMILAHVDHCIQYGEDIEPKDPSNWHDNDDDK